SSGHEGWNTTRALGVLLRVCEAMAYAHAKGVIHRDLKPANIMVGRYGEVYVMDWGLARVSGSKDLHDVRLKDAPVTSQSIQTERREERADTPDSPLVTMDGDVVGTPAYMSPEQAMGKVKELGPASDVYAVGAMLYHLLALEMPYVPKGARMSARSVHLAVVQGAPKPLVELAPKAPAELVAIIEKAMSRELSARYPNMDALASDLRAYLEGRVVSAYESGSWAEAKKWVQRNKPLTVAAAAALLALVGGITLTMLEQRKTEQANTALNEKVAELKQQSREQQLRGLAQDLARFRAQCRTTDGLERMNKPAWQWWLDEADRLLDGRAEDEAAGIAWSPGRKDVQAKLAELRERALPWSDADKAKDIAARPTQRRIRALEEERDEKLQELRGELESTDKSHRALSDSILWLEFRLQSRAWPLDADVASKYAEQLSSTDASVLNSAAWKLVDPDAKRSGPEPLVLASLLARRGVELAPESDSWAVRDTLAWSLVWLGRGDEALAMADSAIALAGKNADQLRSNKDRMQAELARWTEAVRAERESELAELRAELASLPALDVQRQQLA
ncbi:MAG: protein kinase domain-containing protein, partial [Planctomycetota bacterium]